MSEKLNFRSQHCVLWKLKDALAFANLYIQVNFPLDFSNFMCIYEDLPAHEQCTFADFFSENIADKAVLLAHQERCTERFKECKTLHYI